MAQAWRRVLARPFCGASRLWLSSVTCRYYLPVVACDGARWPEDSPACVSQRRFPSGLRLPTVSSKGLRSPALTRGPVYYVLPAAFCNGEIVVPVFPCGAARFACGADQLRFPAGRLACLSVRLSAVQFGCGVFRRQLRAVACEKMDGKMGTLGKRYTLRLNGMEAGRRRKRG